MSGLIQIRQKSVRYLIDEHLEAGRGIEEILDRFRNSVVVFALEKTKGNQSRAAVLLKTHRNNLVRWIHEAKIPVGDEGNFPDKKQEPPKVKTT